MREEQHARLDRAEAVDQGLHRGRRPGIDDHTVDLVGTDHPVAPEVQHVDWAAHRDPDHTISWVSEHRLPERDSPWVMRTYAGHSTAKESNELYRRNLAKGQTGPLGGLRPAHPDRLRPGPRAVARRGRQGRRVDRPQGRHARAARRHPAGRDEHVDDDQRHGGVAAGAVHDRGRGERRRPALAPGHDAERHHQGVPVARDLRVPAGALDAADRGHDRVQRRRGAALEPDQHLLVPPPGGGGHAGPGDRLRALDGAGGARPRARTRGRRDLPAGVRPHVVLRERGHPLRGGAREAPRDGPALGGDGPRALRRGRREAAALPLRRAGELARADGVPAREQHHPDRARGPGRDDGPRRARAGAPAARLERGARAAEAVGPAVVAADPADPRLRDRHARLPGHLRGLEGDGRPGGRAGGRARARRWPWWPSRAARWRRCRT